MKVSEFYDAVGGHYDEALERLQNDEFIAKLLRMMCKDKSMEQLDTAIQNSEAESAFMAVHTLKGIALNLSLANLAEACSELTENLRHSNELQPNTEKLYNDVKHEYERVIDTLAKLDS